jgi:23S rRNA (guanosine2251-2'-O)-methyltransferase
MAGNSKRRGAVRKPGSKKGAQVGSGGQRRKGLEPKGPTPKAQDRTGHPAARKSRRSESRSRSAQRGGPAPVVGRNPVVEALRAQVPARVLMVLDSAAGDPRASEAVALAESLGVQVRFVGRSDLDRLAPGAVHQGIALDIAEFDYADAQDLVDEAVHRDPAGILVVLDGVTDPHNLGAIARSALAFGAGGVIVPSRRSAHVTAAAWKSSAGALARMPVAQVANLSQFLANAREAGCYTVALDGEATTTISDAAQQFADVPVVVIVGGEGEGVSRLVAERADLRAAIPMPGRAESLNASVAAGVALFAVQAQRQP